MKHGCIQALCAFRRICKNRCFSKADYAFIIAGPVAGCISTGNVCKGFCTEATIINLFNATGWTPALKNN